VVAKTPTTVGKDASAGIPPIENPAGISVPRPEGRPVWWLRRADQAAVAVFVLFGLFSTIAWWGIRGGLLGGMVELGRAERKTAHFEVDINSADWPELIQLPQIGETLAKRIVESRRLHGPFRDHEDLLRVRGLGPKTLDRIRPHLRPMPDQGTIAKR